MTPPSRSSSKALPLALAFSGGGAKCAAQAGVLAVLEQAHLPVCGLTGVSAGGLVAVLYGLGHSPQAIRDYFAQTSLLEVWEFDPQRQALFGLDKIRARLRQVVDDKTFADLRIPVTVIAVDMRTGREVRLNSGRLDEAMLATMALPGLFTPLRREGMKLADGGVLNPLPVDAARTLGPRVVAVDVIHDFALDQPTQIFEARGPMGYATLIGRRLGLTEMVEAVYQAASLLTNRLAELNLKMNPPDVLLRPAVGHVGLFAFDRSAEAYQIGEATARAALPQLQALAGSGIRATLTSAWRRVADSLRRLV
jgi:NTE family protein